MALANFSLPYHSVTPAPFLYSGVNTQNPIDDLGYDRGVPSLPAGRLEDSFRNGPYTPPQQYQQQSQSHQTRQQHHFYRQRQMIPAQRRPQDQSEFTSSPTSTYTPPFSQNLNYANYNQDFGRTQQNFQDPNQLSRPTQSFVGHPTIQTHEVPSSDRPEPFRPGNHIRDDRYPDRPIGYTRVNAGNFDGPDTKTSVHAVLDYDDDGDYFEDDQGVPNDAQVTPIQGPIFVKNGSVPVVPLFSYPQLNNGSFVQIPILWTALSVALGVELRGDLVKGAPCIKRHHQLFCPTAGNSYPIDKIETFIDENKALMKRMYGDFEMSKEPGHRKRRAAGRHGTPDGGPSLHNYTNHRDFGSGDSYFSRIRTARQAFTKNPPPVQTDTHRVDVCESKIEIVTPYWARNSAGKTRAVVNTQHFEQAIHQEVCSTVHPERCRDGCGCEQKYKWHRLLAYDPENDCKGIFMDWFLFPSCCICRCDPNKNPLKPNQT